MAIKNTAFFVTLLAIITCGITLAQEQSRDEQIKKAVEQLKSEDTKVRKDAVHTLGLFRAKEYTKDIAKLLKDEDIGVRVSAVRALGDLRANEYVKDIANLLKDESRFVVAWAVHALGDLKAKESQIISKNCLRTKTISSERRRSMF